MVYRGVGGSLEGRNMEIPFSSVRSDPAPPSSLLPPLYMHAFSYSTHLTSVTDTFTVLLRGWSYYQAFEEPKVSNRTGSVLNIYRRHRK
jgi:hypothetical protein